MSDVRGFVVLELNRIEQLLNSVQFPEYPPSFTKQGETACASPTARCDADHLSKEASEFDDIQR